MQRMAEQYWRKVESGGMAYELAPQTLVVGSFRDGLKSGLAAHRAEILKLERENAELKQRIVDDNKAYGCEMRDPSGTIWDHAQKLQKENAALRKDKERLDWLCMTDHWFDVPCDGNWTPESFRVAIDAARKEAQP